MGNFMQGISGIRTKLSTDNVDKQAVLKRNESLDTDKSVFITAASPSKPVSATKTDEYSIDDGKISIFNKIKNLAKGFVSPISSLFSSFKNFAIGASMMTICGVLIKLSGGAFAPALVAIGLAIGTLQLGYGIYKAINANKDKDAENAWQNIGEGVSATLLSMLGAKSALKAAGKNVTDTGILGATKECVKITGSGIKNLKIRNVFIAPRRAAIKPPVPMVNIDAASKAKLKENIESIKNLYRLASTCKTRGKSTVVLDGKLFRIISKDKTVSFINEEHGITITGIQEGGKRKFHILNKSNNTVFNQYEPKKYKIVSREGSFVSEVDTIFGQSIDNVHAQTSAIRTTGGKSLEAAECGRRDYEYNLLDKSFVYDDYIDNVRVRISQTAEILNPDDIAFSQKTVSEIGFEGIKRSMQRTGWTREPINVVETKDGHLVSIDNRRLRAAAETGTPVHAVIHAEDELLSDSFRNQFFVKNPQTKEVVALPRTWGEALYNRLFVNGFVNNGKVVYSKNHPVCGKGGVIFERAMELFDAYKAGRVPYLETR